MFDTMVHVITCDYVPERWRRQWKEATVGNKSLILFEPLVAEILYQLSKRKGEKYALERILWVKGLSTTTMVNCNDNIAFDAGRLYLKCRKYKISLVDAFLLAVAKRGRAEIFTTDYNLKKASKEINVKVNYLPKKALERKA